MTTVYKTTEKHRVSSRKWSEANPEWRREYGRKWREKNPEYGREHAKKNAAARVESSKRWRKNHPEKARLLQRKWYLGLKAWRKANPVKVRIQNHRRRELIRATRDTAAINVLSQLVSSASRLECGICGKNMPKKDRTLDHIIPLAKGGTGDVWNLRIVHLICNIRKSDKMPDELNFVRDGTKPKTQNPRRRGTCGDLQIDIQKRHENSNE